MSYADFGCSNGYVTERIRRLTGAERVWGFDHLEEHLARGRRQYPAIEFSLIDLNRPNADLPGFDFVSCFETLEHVGNLEAAIGNLLAAIKPGGTGLVTVPIEIGPRGIAKFIAKLAYGYNLSELPQSRALQRRYATALLTGARVSRFRDERRAWGTHFGFDYRDVDDALRRHGVPFGAWNSGTTRFYCIRKAVLLHSKDRPLHGRKTAPCTGSAAGR